MSVKSRIPDLFNPVFAVIDAVVAGTKKMAQNYFTKQADEPGDRCRQKCLLVYSIGLAIPSIAHVRGGDTYVL